MSTANGIPPSAHAEKAVELYNGLYSGAMTVDDDNGPTKKQLASKLTMIKGAEGVLEQARADAKEYPVAVYDHAAIEADIEAQEAREDAAEVKGDWARTEPEPGEKDMEEPELEEGDEERREHTPPEFQHVSENLLSQAEDVLTGGYDDDMPDLPTPPPHRGKQ